MYVLWYSRDYYNAVYSDSPFWQFSSNVTVLLGEEPLYTVISCRLNIYQLRNKIKVHVGMHFMCFLSPTSTKASSGLYQLYSLIFGE